MQHFQRAIEIFGTQKRLAECLGVQESFISQILNGRRPIPPKLCKQIELATKGEVTREQLRPEIFGPVNANGETEHVCKPCAHS